MEIGKKNIIKFVAVILIVVFTLTANILSLTTFDQALRFFVGGTIGGTTGESEIEKYNMIGATKEEVNQAALNLVTDIAEEGIVLLQADQRYMPYKSEKTTFSIFGRGSVYLKLHESLSNAGFGVNDTLKTFYETGTGSLEAYKRGSGPVNFGAAMNYELNEVPLSIMQAENGLLESSEETTPIFIISRAAGEGVDPVRGMYVTTYDRETATTTARVEDYGKSYLELSSEELEIIDYLNSNFDDIVLVINSTNPIEMGFLAEYENIHNVLLVPDVGSGDEAFASIIKGEVNPSGRLVNTYPYDSLSSAAAQNVGDFVYFDESGNEICNYISYEEGIYVGYRYFETRYEDAILGQGQAGDYIYEEIVQYPFGYGLSYTQFEWTDYQVQYNENTKQFTASIIVKNIGDVAGKDVVQLYVQKPYTEYDKMNGLEKSAIELAGFAKTSLLEPGDSESISIQIDLEIMKSYDSKVAKTYIVEEGDYYLVAATDAHQAINNILLKKGVSEDSITGTGCEDLAYVTDLKNTSLVFVNGLDATTYAYDAVTNQSVTNQFDFAQYDGMNLLSRNNWQETFPTPDGEVHEYLISGWGNTVNGFDANGNPTSYVVYKTMTNEQISQYNMIGKEAALNTDAQTYSDIVYDFSAGNDIELIDLRGKSFDDPLWNELLDNLSIEDINKYITQVYYGADLIQSIKKPETNHADSATGLIGSQLDVRWMDIPLLAQTFNESLSHRYGNIIGQDALRTKSNNIHINGWYAPGVNLHRTAFTGRSREYYSEDPFLTGIFAKETILGAAEYGLATFIKHFAVNEQELHRGDKAGENGIVTWVNEQAIRELYLRPFEMAMKSGSVEQFYFEQGNKSGELNKVFYDVSASPGVMTSFNRIGLTWAGGSYNLITNVLRNEWGFNGMVITDFDNGGYMDTEQSLYAGSSGKLNLVNICDWSLDTNSQKEIYYAREAIHQMLYTEVNSSAMNGIVRGTQISKGFPVYAFILIGLDIVALLGIYFILRPLSRRRKKVL